MKTLEEIVNALQAWQEADPQGRSASLVTVRSEKPDADGRTERRLNSSFGGDLVALTAAHFNMMRNDSDFRRMVLAASKAFADRLGNNVPLDDDEEEEEEEEAGERNARNENENENSASV